MSESRQFATATLTIATGSQQGTEVPIHFNPASLQYSITNTLEQGSGNRKKQFVSQSSGKLTMDLIYDTTDSGEDVRGDTEQLARLMKPEKRVPPVVKFAWGQYSFSGMVEQFKETIDFFSEDGVPLRSAVNLTLAAQDETFDHGTSDDADVTGGEDGATEVPTASGESTTQTAARGGNPAAGRDLASANGLASMRFTAGASLTVGGSVQLAPPVAFASGGAGFGLSAGAGIGPAGVEVGSSIGGRASAGVPASLGAFAGLRTAPPAASRALDPAYFLRPRGSVALATSDNARFHVGGRAVLGGMGSLNTDVGQGSSLAARLDFTEE